MVSQYITRFHPVPLRIHDLTCEISRRLTNNIIVLPGLRESPTDMRSSNGPEFPLDKLVIW